MAQRIDVGPTGVTVAGNVRRLREAQRLSFADMDRALEESGHPIRPLGLRRIEQCGRRVDVDDLVALADVLGVCPATLLMPVTGGAADRVAVTGMAGYHVAARDVWAWLTARGVWNPNDDPREFAWRSVPVWAAEDGV